VTDLAAELAAVQQAYREGLRPLLGVPWRTGRSHEGNIWARTGSQEDWKDDFPAGQMRTGELAAEACDSHNAMLDLEWLTEAGFDVGLTCRQGSWCVSLSPDLDGWTAVCGQGVSPAEALAAARKWAEERGS
jgi:hypothetical protein